MNGILMLLIGLAVGYVIGFLWGRFGKKIWQWLMKLLKKIQKMPLDEDDKADAIHDDELDEDGGKLKDLLPEFLDTEQTEGIDDNPDVQINPIFPYLIAQQKARDRLEFARKRAEEEGYNLEEEGEGGPAVQTKENALNILIAVGARTTSVMSASDSAALAAKEARRKMKNIESYLSKSMEIDTTSTKREPGKRMTSKVILNPYEKAMDTKDNPAVKKTERVAARASRRSRIQLKEVLKKRPDLQQLQEERSEASQDSALAEVAEGKASAEDEGEEEEGEEDWEGEEGDEELLA